MKWYCLIKSLLIGAIIFRKFLKEEYHICRQVSRIKIYNSRIRKSAPPIRFSAADFLVIPEISFPYFLDNNKQQTAGMMPRNLLLFYII